MSRGTYLLNRSVSFVRDTVELHRITKPGGNVRQRLPIFHEPLPVPQSRPVKTGAEPMCLHAVQVNQPNTAGVGEQIVARLGIAVSQPQLAKPLPKAGEFTVKRAEVNCRQLWLSKQIAERRPGNEGR